MDFRLVLKSMFFKISTESLFESLSLFFLLKSGVLGVSKFLSELLILRLCLKLFL